MTDEKYEFVTDLREKKSIARSARGRKTHCGMGGRVKLPSDNMTNKEWKAMNGKVESYRLNEPMTYEEFKKMPDDLKIAYVKALVKKFNVPMSRIAEMLGTKQNTFSFAMRSIGYSAGCRSGKEMWDQEGWINWCNGVKTKDAAPEEGAVCATDEPAEAEPEIGEAGEDGTIEEITASVAVEGPGRCVEPDWEELYRRTLAEKEKLECECAYLHHQRDEAWREAEILRAKVEMVEMIFGKKA